MRWGFIGTGRIAQRIMPAFAQLPSHQVTAAYTRRPEQLVEFCDQWNIPHRFDSIQALVDCCEVDAIYLATPHIVHLEHFRQAIKGKKPILCEKPMGMSEEETREMVKLAQCNETFLMEGLWTRFFPLYSWLRQLIVSGEMGRAYNVMADFSYHSQYDPQLRFFRKDLGGGSMRGAGIYPLSLAVQVFGAMPVKVQAMADIANKVDLRCSALLEFPGGGMAEIFSGFQGESVQGANIAFEKGSVWIPDFWHPQRAVIRRNNVEEVIEYPFIEPGFQFEIEEVERCVHEGLLESPLMPLNESIGLSATLDCIYAQLGQSDF